MFKVLNLIMAYVLIVTPVYSEDEVFTIKKQTANAQEFFVGTHPGTVMMKVNVLGAVNKPGVYNVPVNSELSSVISFAGGTKENAKLQKVFVRSRKNSEYEIKKINMEGFFSDAKEQPYKLRPDDYVYVESKTGVVSVETFRNTLWFATIFGIIVSAIAIEDRHR